MKFIAIIVVSSIIGFIIYWSVIYIKAKKIEKELLREANDVINDPDYLNKREDSRMKCGSGNTFNKNKMAYLILGAVAGIVLFSIMKKRK